MFSGCTLGGTLWDWDVHSPPKATAETSSFHFPYLVLLSLRIILRSLLVPSASSTNSLERKPILFPRG